jgi:hypothetical protein
MSLQRTDVLRQTRHSYPLAAEPALNVGHDTSSLLLQGFCFTVESDFEGIEALQEGEKLALNGRWSPLPIRHGNAGFRRKRCRLMSETHDGSPSIEARAHVYHKTAVASAKKCSSRDAFEPEYPVTSYLFSVYIFDQCQAPHLLPGADGAT